MSNPIPAENALTGTTAWLPTKTATTQIQAYANKTSLDPGQSISFFVSTQTAGTTYTLSVYRLGWYGGNGACQKLNVTGLTGAAQGYWDESGQTLNNCPTLIYNSTTHLSEAGWTASYTWTVPGNAVTGVYLVQFTDANGYQTYTSFVVRGSSADYVYVRPTTTDEAYNDWGGYSLYSATPAVKVSSNRPNVMGNGTGGLFRFEIPGIKWLESQGYNLAYLTNVDIHENATQLLNYRAFLSAGHDEYWSKEMRDGVEYALTQGVGLGFLGANASYWQIRFEPDAASNPDRTIVCYKVEPGTHTLYQDPYYGVDDTRVTTRWQDSPVTRPENTMIGILYQSYLAANSNVAWTVDAAAASPYLTGTGLVPGQSYGYDLVGYEFDSAWYPGNPSNLQIIGTSPVTDINGTSMVSNTTTYIAPSGALVFASGSIGWTWCLDAYRFSTQPGGTPAAIPAM